MNSSEQPHLSDLLTTNMPETAASSPLLTEQSKSEAGNQTHKMDKKSKIKSVAHLWEKDSVNELFQGICLAASEGKGPVDKDADTSSEHPPEKESSTEDPALPEARLCEKMFCVTCSTEFEEREEQKEHFKSDWHRFNLKRKLKGQEGVSETNFEVITNAGDLSSISGSDSPSEDEDLPTVSVSAKSSTEIEDEDFEGGHIEGIGRRHPRVFLRNVDGELMSLYRCVVHGKKNQADSVEELISLVERLPSEKMWCVAMLSAGHFAAALFDGDKVVEHKTFHRYVVRAKRGTIQSTRDGKGQAPKSGGASIRRYCEAALSQEIQELLTSWKDHLKNCHRIFLRLASHNKAVFFGGKTPLFDKKDPKIRSIPFQTRRPTFKELKRVHDLLSTVECYGNESSLKDHITVSPVKPSVETKPRPTVPKPPTEFKPVKILQDEASTDEEDVDVELMAENLTISMSDLQPFSSTKRPRKRPKKKKTNQDAPAKDETVPALDPETAALRNSLYTACKTNNSEQLKELLSGLKMKNTTQTCENITDDAADVQCSVPDKLEDLVDSVADIADQNPDTATESLKSRNNIPDNPASASEQDKDDFHKMYCIDLLNSPFGDNRSTLLHVASQAGHKDVVSLLMEAGADPATKDNRGQLPYQVAANKDTRNEFRRFISRYPDMYDYTKAQIPPPLSEEAEMAKKAREAERRKALKKAKKEREKDQKAEEAREREENREKQRYLALSDREKRALAAEKRLTAQATAAGETPRVLSRCFQCATDITGKVPFEYHQYKFCTTKCLKAHRAGTDNTSHS